MVHQGQRLPLGLEAGHHLARVHARLEHFEGDFAADRFVLFGQEDDPEAAFPDHFQQLVRAKHRAGTLGHRIIDGDYCGRGGRLQEAFLLIEDAEQLLDALQGRRVMPASLLQVGQALLGPGDLPGSVEQLFFPNPVCHGLYSQGQALTLYSSMRNPGLIPLTFF
jgi:hypothetical protein